MGCLGPPTPGLEHDDVSYDTAYRPAMPCEMHTPGPRWTLPGALGVPFGVVLRPRSARHAQRSQLHPEAPPRSGRRATRPCPLSCRGPPAPPPPMQHAQPPRILKRIARVLDRVHGAQGNFERPCNVISTRKGPSVFQVQEYLTFSLTAKSFLTQTCQLWTGGSGFRTARRSRFRRTRYWPRAPLASCGPASHCPHHSPYTCLPLPLPLSLTQPPLVPLSVPQPAPLTLCHL